MYALFISNVLKYGTIVPIRIPKENVGMLKKYLESKLMEMLASSEQKDAFLDILYRIRTEEELLRSFLQEDSVEFLSKQNNMEEMFESLESQATLNLRPTEASLGDENTAEEKGTLYFDEELDSVVKSSSNETLDLSASQKTVHHTSEIVHQDSDNAPLLGRYLDMGLLGRGGMGEVRKIRDLKLKRNLAMKIIHPKLLEKKGALSRFIEEAQVVAQLQHPNILPIHELGQLPDGRYYFTMKEVKGIEFTDLIDDVHDISDEEVWKTTPDGNTFRKLIQIFHKICETIAFAHTLGVIHRDLKPENIMIGGFGEVLVVDWGIAKVLGGINYDTEDAVKTDRSEKNFMATRIGMVAGTPAYMSPEQANGQIDKIDTHSDVYTLGAILYEILSGTPPFTGSTASEIMEKVKTTKPQSLSTSINEEKKVHGGIDNPYPLSNEESGKIPLILIEICEKAMQKDISDRYPSATELAQDILDWLEGAQKRDKALKEVEKANQLLSKAKMLEKKYSKLWSQSNQLFEDKGLTSDEAWKFWKEGEAAKAEAEGHHRLYIRTLHGALVYDSEIEEANLPIAELLINDLVKAVANGERQKRVILKNQFDKHLLPLSKRKREALLLKFQEESTNEIILLRTRRGALVGRKKQREEIKSTLNNRHRLVSLVGTAGVGKTRLALEIIHDLSDTMTKSYFCDLTEANEELGVVRLVAKAMDLRLRNIDPAGQLGELFAEQKTILVLDNLEQVVSPVGAVIQRWLKQSDSLRIIATSRVRLQIPEEKSFIIHPLSSLEAMEIFTKRGQKADGQFVLNDSTRPIVGRLITQLDKLPLAIELAAARLNIFKVYEIETRLKERFSLLRSRSKETQALQGALDWSWDLLKPWDKAALSQSSVFHGGFDINAIEGTVAVGQWDNAPAAFDIFQDLSDGSLLILNKSADGEIRYGMLESIRQYAKEKLNNELSVEQNLSGPKALKDTEHRHAKYFSQYGQKEFLSSLDKMETTENWNKLFLELDNLVAGTNHGMGEGASLCCLAALKILGMKGPVSLGVDIVNKVLENPNVPNRRSKQLQIRRTQFLRISGRMNEARAERKKISRSSSRRKNESLITTLSGFDSDISREPTEESPKPEEIEPLEDNLPSKVKKKNKSVESISSSQNENTRRSQPPIPKAPKERREEEDQRLEAEALLERGRVEEAESLYDEAMTFYGEAMEIFEQIDNAKGIVETLIEKSKVKQIRGDTTASIPLLQRALERCEAEGFFLLQAKVLSGLAEGYRQLGEYDSALEDHFRALKINRQIGNKALEGSNLGNIGLVFTELSEYEKSLEYYGKALDIHREIESKRSEGIVLGNIATVYREQGEYEKSLEHYTKAIDIHREIGNKRSEGSTIGNMGLIYQEQGDHDKALEYYGKALNIHREIGNKRSEGHTLGNIAVIYQFQSNYEKALEQYSKAIDIAQEIGNKLIEGINLGNMAHIYQTKEDYEKALEHYTKALDIHRSIGNNHLEGATIGNIGDLYHRQNEPLKAQSNLEQAIQICDETYSVAAGAFRGTLALSLAEDGVIRQALEVIKVGETQVMVMPLEHGKFLCKKAQVFHISKESVLAVEALNQAVEIAETLSVAPDSELGQLIIETHGILGQSPPQKSAPTRELTEEEEDLLLEAEKLLERGRVEEAESLYEEAIAFYDEAMTLFETVDNAKGIVETLIEQAKVERVRGGSKASILYLQRALERCEAEGFFLLQAQVFSGLGEGYRYLGEYDTSIAHFSRALEINKQIGNRDQEGINLGSLAIIYKYQGDYEKALDHYTKAIDIAREIGNKRVEGINLGNVALVYQDHGMYEKALENHFQALENAREIGNKRSEGVTLGNIATVYKEQGEFEKALDHYEQTLNIAREIGNKRSEGSALGNIAVFYQDHGVYEQALIHYSLSLEIARESGDKRFESINLGNIAIVCKAQGDYEKALDHYTKALDIAREIGDKRYEGVTFGNIGDLYYKLGKPVKAQSNLEKSLQICDESFPSGAGAFRGTLALIIAQNGEPNEALALIEAGEPQVMTFHLEYGKFLCKKAQVLNIAEKQALAFEALHQALEIAEPLSIRPDSELGQLISETQEILGQPPAPKPTTTRELTEEEEDRLLEAEELLERGRVEEAESLYDEAMALYGKAMTLFEQLDNAKGIVETLIEQANIEQVRGDYNTSIYRLQQALERCQKESFFLLQAEVLSGLGVGYRYLGQFNIAIDYFSRALVINKQIGNLAQEGITCANIGIAYKYQGGYDKALEEFRKALDIAREIGNRRFEAHSLNQIAAICKYQGVYEKSLENYRMSLEIARDIRDRASEAVCIGSIGTVYQLNNEYEKSLKNYVDSLDIFQELGQIRNIGISLLNLGNHYIATGDYNKALENYTNALVMHREIGNRRDEGLTLGNIGITYQGQGAHQKAHEYFTKALAIHRELGVRPNEATMLMYLGKWYQVQDAYEDSIEYFNQALKLSRELGNKGSEGLILGNFGELYYKKSELVKAQNFLERGIALCGEVSNREAGALRGTLALVFAQTGDIRQALEVIKVGETQVMVMPLEHGKFLCKKAQVLHSAEKPILALEALNQALEIAEPLSVRPDSELGQLISETQEILGQPPAPKHTPTRELTEEEEDRLLEAEKLLERGRVEEAESLYDEAMALFVEAMTLFQQLDDAKGIVQALIEMANIEQVRGDSNASLTLLQRALERCEMAGFFLLRAEILNGLGESFRHLGEYDTSIGHHSQALHINKQIGHKAQEGVTLGHMAIVYKLQGLYGKALEHHSQALDIAREIGNKRVEGVTLGNMALVFQAQGGYEKAYEYHNQALDIAREVGNKRKECSIIGNMALVFQAQGGYEKALEHYSQAIGIAREIGNTQNIFLSLGHMATIYWEQGAYETSIEHHRQALDISRENGNRVTEGITLGNIGDLYYQLSEPVKAQSNLEQAIQICDEIIPAAAGSYKGTLALILAEDGEVSEALILIEEGESQVMTNPLEHGKFLCKKAQVLHSAEKQALSLEALNQAVEVAETLSVPPESDLGRLIRGTQEILGQSTPQKSAHTRELTEAEEDLLLEAEELLESGRVEEAESLYDEAMAFYDAAMEIFEQIDNAKGIVETLIAHARVEKNRGDTSASISRLQKALERCQSEGFFQLQAEALSGLGVGYRYLGEYDTAIESYSRALDINIQIGNRVEEGINLGSIAVIYYHQGENKKALEQHSKALNIHREVGNKQEEGKALGNIAVVYKEQGDYEKSLAYYTQAIDIAREIGYKRGEGINIGNMAGAYEELGDYEKALKYHTLALNIHIEIGNKRSKGITLGNIASIYQVQGKYEKALEHFTLALNIHIEFGNKRSETITLGNIALVYHDQGENEQALAHYTQALVIAREIGNKRSEGKTLLNMAIVYKEQGVFDKALDHYTRALSIAQEIGNKRDEGLNLGNIGCLYHSQNAPLKARLNLERAIAICDEIFPGAAGGFRGTLALIFAQGGEINKALRAIEVGELQVMAIPLEYGKFLCKKAQVLHIAEEPVLALEALSQAVGVAETLSATLNSELGQLIRETKDFLGPSKSRKPTPTRELTVEEEDLLLEAEELLEKGRVEEAESLYDEAMDFYDQAMSLFEQLENTKGIVETLIEQSKVRQVRGENNASILCLKQALERCETEGFFLLKANVFLGIGLGYSHIGETETSVENYYQALIINRQVGNKIGEGRTLSYLANAFQEQGQNKRALEYYTQALDIHQEVGHKRNQGLTLGNMAIIFHQQGDYERALEYYAQALDIHQEVGNKRQEGVLIGNIGTVYHTKGLFEKALEYYSKALAIHEEIQNQLQIGSTLRKMANVYRAQGFFEKALGHYRRSLDIDQKIGNKRGEGITHGNIGDLYHKLKEHTKAKSHLEEAIQICDESIPAAANAFRGTLALIFAQAGDISQAHAVIEKGEPQIESFPIEHGKFLCKKAQVFQIAEKEILALEALNQAVLIAETLSVSPDSDLGQLISETQDILGQSPPPKTTLPKELTVEEEDLLLEAEELLERGRVEEAESLYDEAMEFYDQAMEIFEQLDYGKGIVEILIEQAKIQQVRGYTTAAIPLLQQALERCQTEGFFLLQAQIYSGMGIVYRYLGEVNIALEHYTKALNINRQIGNMAQEGVNLINMAILYQGQGQNETALEHYTEALNIARTIGSKPNEGVALGNIAISYQEHGDYEKALEHHTKALNIAREIGNKQSEGVTLSNMAIIYQEQGDYEKALENYTKSLDIAHEIGGKRSRGITLGNIGDLYIKQNDSVKAQSHLEEAIQICDETFPLAAGAFRGTLALILAKNGNIKQALAVAEAGEPQVMTRPLEHGKFLCKKAQVLNIAEKLALAFEAFHQALEITEPLSVRPDTELGQLIRETQEILGQPPAPKSIPTRESTESEEDLLLEAEELLESGRVEEAESLYDEAMEFYDQAMILFKQLDNAKGIIETLIEQAKVEKNRGDSNASILLLQQALELCQKEGFFLLQAQVLCGKGEGHRFLGEYNTALEHHSRALDINKQIGNRAQEGINFGNIGDVFSVQGDYKRSLESYMKALDIAREIGNKRAEAISLENIAGVYNNLGEYEESLNYHTRALIITQEIGDRNTEGIVYGGMAILYSDHALFEQSLESYTKALDIHREIGDKRQEGVNLGNIANVYQLQGVYTQSLNYYTKAINIAQELNDKRSEGTNIGNMANIYQLQGGFIQALSHYTKALIIAQELNDKRGEGIILGNMGELYYKLKEPAKAQTHLEPAIQICDESMPAAAAAFRGTFSLIVAQRGKSNEALTLIEDGEPQIMAMPLEHGKFLCKKAQVLHIAEESALALEALNQAVDIAEKLSVPPDSDLGQLVLETQDILGQSPPPKPTPTRELTVEEEDLLLEAEDLLERGRVEEAESLYKEAIAFYDEAMPLFETVDNAKGIVETLIERAKVEGKIGNNNASILCLQQALERCQKESFFLLQAQVYSGLGNGYDQLGEYETAIEHHSRALEINKQIGNRAEEGINLGNMAIISHSQSENEKALEQYAKALDIHREIGNKRFEGIILSNIANVYQNQGEVEKALDHYTQALDIHREIGNKCSEGITLGNIGALYVKLSDSVRAQSNLEQAIQIAYCD